MPGKLTPTIPAGSTCGSMGVSSGSGYVLAGVGVGVAEFGGMSVGVAVGVVVSAGV